MQHAALNLIHHYGYLGLAVGLIISTLGLFSSEVFLLLGGVAIRQRSLALGGVVAVALLAQIVGALASHALGQYGGVPLLERYGRYVLLSKRDLARSHRWFQKYGSVATALGYSLPLIRGYIGYAAGIAAEPRRQFAMSALIGCIVWTALMLSLGYYLGGNLGAIERVIHPVSYVLAAVVLLAVVWFVRHRYRDARA